MREDMKKLVILILAGLLLGGCGGDDDNKIYHVAYVVDGFFSCKSFNISFQNEYGTNRINAERNWSYTFDAKKGDYLYLHVYNPHCYQTLYGFGAQIQINGEVFKSDACNDPNCREITLEGSI